MLSSLTQPNYPKAALGLEQESVTALALQKEGKGRFGIKQAATVELPVNLLTPSFTEQNISKPKEMLVLLEEASRTPVCENKNAGRSACRATRRERRF
jgi:hypothetical protein